MRLWRVIRQRTRSLFHRRRADTELHDELALHYQELVRENIAAGMGEREAHESGQADLRQYCDAGGAVSRPAVRQLA